MTSQPEICHVCHALSESVSDRSGVPTCGSCKTLFWFAEVLLEADATEEEIIPTLAFARYAEILWPIRNSEARSTVARDLVSDFPAFELVAVVDGVPVLRMKHAVVEVIRYRDSDLAKSIRIRVFSRFAKPAEIAKLYWSLCKREKLPIHSTSAGRLTWNAEQMHLVADIGPLEEIEAFRLHEFSEYPQVRRFAFPLDTVVRNLLQGLLGQGQEKNLMFGAVLSDLGRGTTMSQEAAVTACVLWQLRGERSPSRVPRDEHVAEFVNRLLLEPLEKKPMTISRNDANWRNAKKVSGRLDLCNYLLQEIASRDNTL